MFVFGSVCPMFVLSLPYVAWFRVPIDCKEICPDKSALKSVHILFVEDIFVMMGQFSPCSAEIRISSMMLFRDGVRTCVSGGSDSRICLHEGDRWFLSLGWDARVVHSQYSVRRTH